MQKLGGVGLDGIPLQRFEPRQAGNHQGVRGDQLFDSIQFAFLNLVGFDILFFVPTGYQCIERYFTQPFANEQQIGEYLYLVLLLPLGGRHLQNGGRPGGGPVKI